MEGGRSGQWCHGVGREWRREAGAGAGAEFIQKRGLGAKENLADIGVQGSGQGIAVLHVRSAVPRMLSSRARRGEFTLPAVRPTALKVPVGDLTMSFRNNYNSSVCSLSCFFEVCRSTFR